MRILFTLHPEGSVADSLWSVGSGDRVVKYEFVIVVSTCFSVPSYPAQTKDQVCKFNR